MLAPSLIPAQYVDELVAVLRLLDGDALERIARVLHSAFVANNTIFCAGNGGSATTANHLATDLTKLTADPRHPHRLRTMALTDSISTISAIANDMAYEEIFAEQLRSFMRVDDVIIGISTSGASPNVVRAIEHGNRFGAVTIAIVGDNKGPLRHLAQHALVIASNNVQRVEDVSVVAVHLLCLMTREKMLAGTTTTTTTWPVLRPVMPDALPASTKARRNQEAANLMHGRSLKISS